MYKLLKALLYPDPPSILGMIMGGLGIASAAQKLLGNETASDEATAARDWQRQQTTMNQEWQQNMRATQYQTSTADMKAAGLNPMLAYHQGGAGTPMGGTPGASMASPSNTGGVDMQTAAQIEQIRAQTEKLRAETEVVKDSIIERDESGEVKVPKTWENRLKHHMGEREWYEAKNALEKVYLTREEAAYVTQEIKNAIQHNTIRQLSIPRLINEARAQESGYMKHVAPYTGEIGKLVHSAAEAKEAFSGRTYRRR